MELKDKHCVPCERGTNPLSDTVEDELLRSAKGWEIDRAAVHKIRKVFTLRDFGEAIDFVNHIAKIADREGHHPVLHIFYKRVTVELYSHEIVGLSENDFIMAAKIEA